MSFYYNDCNNYPNSTTTGTNNGCPAGVTLGTYMIQIPNAPTPADGSCSIAQNEYAYVGLDNLGGDCASSGLNCVGYEITFCLGAQTGELAAGVHTATQAGVR